MRVWKEEVKDKGYKEVKDKGYKVMISLNHL